MVGTVTYELSKHLDLLLRPIVTSLPNRIGSGDSLINKLSTLEDAQDLFLGSLDVVALFPNVHIDLFLQQLPNLLEEHKHLWVGLDNPLSQLSSVEICSLIGELCKCTYFKFENTTYKQLKGVPMGSPVSVAIAEIFMHMIETAALTTCSAPSKPVFYGRYIDDIIHVTRTEEEFDQFHHHINNNNGGPLEFTTEKEQDKSLPFLDIKITRAGNKLNFSVYRKPTHTDRYCHPKSAVPHSVLSCTVQCMRLRAQRYCSSQKVLEIELDHLKNALRKNGYGTHQITKHLHKPVYGPKNKLERSLANIVLPFFGPLSYRIRSILTEAGYTVYFKSPAKLGRSLFRRIDWAKKDPLDKTNVVYCAPCSDCSTLYIGETKRSLRVRGKEHKAAITAGDTTHSALAEHCINQRHNFRLESLRAIDSEAKLRKRRVKESLYISASNNSCNNKQFSVHISQAWLSLGRLL